MTGLPIHFADITPLINKAIQSLFVFLKQAQELLLIAIIRPEHKEAEFVA